MIAVCKLFFDISLYYTLSGFYFQLWLGEVPSVAGLILLFLAAVLFHICCARSLKTLSYLSLLLPVGMLLFNGGLVSMLHLLPIWGYAVFCMVSQRSVADYETFREQFKKGALLLLILLPGLLFAEGSGTAFIVCVPYLLIQLISGIACLRSLREKNESKKHLVIMLVITAVCGILTLLGIPQWLMGIINTYVIQVLIYGFRLLIMLMAYAIFALFEWLVSINGKPEERPMPQSQTNIAEIMGVQESDLVSADGRVLWLEIAGYIVAAIAIVLILFFLIRKILRSGKQLFKSVKQSGWEEEYLRLESEEKEGRFPRIRPRDPRKAVRYYYGKYMRQCRKRGLKIRKSWTCHDLQDAGSGFFVKDDLQEMTEIYEIARYDTSGDVNSETVKRASAVWKRLKKTK